MNKSILGPLLLIIAVVQADLTGPFLLWGHESVLDLQPRALLKANEDDFAKLYQDAKAVIIFLRNTSAPLDSRKYPRFQQLIRENPWTYLPQQFLKTDPINYNANVEYINLYGDAIEEEDQILKGYNDGLAIYGPNDVLGIFASRDEESHEISKREAKAEEAESPTTTSQTLTDEVDKSFVYVADGKKAALVVSKAPILNLSFVKESMVLEEHNKAITFDNQKAKGYGRLIIVFTYDSEKVFLRFNFSLIRQTWAVKGCEVEYKDFKTFLPIVGNEYTVPSAPIGFSYRCGIKNMLFTNGNDTLSIQDYQLQPWLKGSPEFGDVYECVGFFTTPILCGIFVTIFLAVILSIGIIALLEIKTPNRFESSRSKQLTFTIQE